MTDCCKEALDRQGPAKHITVFCDAPSHPLWERVYACVPLDVDPYWEPRTETVGGVTQNVRRGGGMDLVDGTGKPLRQYAIGRNKEGQEAFRSRLEQAGLDMGNGGSGKPVKFGRRYLLRCPECGDAVRRSGDRLTPQFDRLHAAGMQRISLENLRSIPL